MSKWKLLKKEKVFAHRYVMVEKWLMRLPNGRERYFFMGGGPYDFVMVGAVTRDKKVIFLKQYFISEQKKVFSMVAGIIEPGDTPLATAKRELLEETGYKAKRWVPLGTSNKGKYTTGKVYYYLALDAEQVQEQRLEGTEDIDVVSVSFTEAQRMLSRHQVPDIFAEVCARRALDYLVK